MFLQGIGIGESDKFKTFIFGHHRCGLPKRFAIALLVMNSW